MSALDRSVADPPPWPVLGERSPLDGLRRRTVTRTDLVGHAIAVVCPSASAMGLALALPSIVGPGAWLSVLLGFVTAYLLAVTFGQFASRLACAGSLYTYATRGLGAGAGLVVAASMLAGYAAIALFGLTAAGDRVSRSVSTLAGSPEPSHGLAAAVVVGSAAICVAVMLRGVRWSTRIALVSEAFALTVLVALVLLAAVAEGLPAASFFSLEGADPVRIVVGAASVLLVTVGFESTAALGAEADRPFLSVPRSMTWTIALSGALFLLSMTVHGDLTSTPGAGPAQRWFPGAETQVADGLLLLVLGLSFFACALCAWTALTRIVFSLARDRVLPEVLGIAHPRWKTPRAAILATVPLAAIPVVGVLATTLPVRELANTFLSAATVVLFVPYAVVCVAVPVFVRRLDESTPGATATAAAALTATVTIAAVDGLRDLREGRWVETAAAALAAVAGLLWFLWVRRREPSALRRMGAYDETVRDDVLGGGRGHGADSG